ncbi:MAG: indolepyruvate oxidoreductase subunit beta [Spirochaetes bacterium]|nr:indolepyruvate oxidoreductase subunit beta [Spirochaetota bacterium]
MDDVKNILLVGVGGQGIILASTILSQAALLSGHDVKNNEVHGMAQRGGSVVAQIRFGRKVFSPLISRGRADYLISLEKLESLRYLDFCNSGTKVVVNTQEIVPVTVTSGGEEYPKNIETVLQERLKHVLFVDALSIARESGNEKTANVVLIGAMSRYLPFDEKTLLEAISSSVKEKFVDINIKAFYGGKSAAVSD